jgi:mRNA interferase MazF
MSANNYIQIKETYPETYDVSERDYESEGEIQAIGLFDSLKLAVKKAEEHIQKSEYSVEYGIRFSLLKDEDQLATNRELLPHKDFNRWNELKKHTDEEGSRLYTVREIWWCQLGLNIGSELNGKGTNFLRPAIILRGFGSDACLVAPLTTSAREHPLRLAVGIIDGSPARANLSQLRVVDTRRLVEKMGFLEQDIFTTIRKAARNLL